MESMNNRIQGVLFDMDGVLIDDEPTFEKAFLELGARYGYPDTLKLHRTVMGVSRPDSRRICREWMGEDYPFDKIYDGIFRVVVEKTLAGNMPLKKGVAECISGLKRRGIKIALATGTSREYVEKYLPIYPELTDVFDAVLCGGEAAASKPAPDVYLEAAARLGLSPEVCIGVEDSRMGVQSVSSAGCLCVMIPDLIPYSEELQGYVDVVLPDLTGLCPLIDRLNQTGTLRS